MNVEGTSWVVSLARKMPQLSAFVHVSTAYSHCYRQSITETFYSTETVPQDMIKLCQETKDKSVLDAPEATKKLIGQFPNTYTFTKALAEQLLQEEASDLPLAIVRPSIVIAAWKEPIPGWVDNFNGPTGNLIFMLSS